MKICYAETGEDITSVICDFRFLITLGIWFVYKQVKLVSGHVSLKYNVML